MQYVNVCTRSCSGNTMDYRQHTNHGNPAVLLKMSRSNGLDSLPVHVQTEHEGSSEPEGSSGVEGSSQEGSTVTLKSSQNDYTATGKLKKCFKTIYRVSSSLFGLIIMLIAFSFLGALIFMALEAPHEQKYKGNINKSRTLLISQMVTSSKNLTNQATDLDRFRNEMKMLLIQYEADVKEAYTHNVKSSSEDKVWDFWSSLFFAGTVYTTIGYGHMAPATDLGRLVCMVYAGFGIPLALLVFADLGKRFTIILKFVWAFVRRYYYTGYCRRIRKPFKRSTYDLTVGEGDETDDRNGDNMEGQLRRSDGSKTGSRLVYGYEVDDEFNIPITVAVAILFIYILLGSLMYTIWEEWSFLEAFYFVFISISTIGFGDVVPAHPKFFILSFTYIFIGLSLVSMCVNVAIEFFSDTVTKAKAKMDKAKKRIGEAKKKVTQAGKNAKTKMHEVGKNLKTNIAEEARRHRKFSKQDRSHSNTPVPPDRDGDRRGLDVERVADDGSAIEVNVEVGEVPRNGEHAKATENTYDEIKNVHDSDQL